MVNVQLVMAKISDVVFGFAIAALILIYLDFFDVCAAEEVCSSSSPDQDFEDLVAVGYKKLTGRNPINLVTKERGFQGFPVTIGEYGNSFRDVPMKSVTEELLEAACIKGLNACTRSCPTPDGNQNCPACPAMICPPPVPCPLPSPCPTLNATYAVKPSGKKTTIEIESAKCGNTKISIDAATGAAAVLGVWALAATAAAIFFFRKSRSPAKPDPREAAAAAAERRNGGDAIGGGDMIAIRDDGDDRPRPGPGMALNFAGSAFRGLMERGPTVEELYV